MHLKKSWLWLLAASIGLSLGRALGAGRVGPVQAHGPLLLVRGPLIRADDGGEAGLFNSRVSENAIRGCGRQMSWREAVLTTASAEFAGVTTPGGVGMPATYIFLFHRLGFGVPEAVGLEGLIVVTDLVFYVTVMPLAALVLLFEVGAKPDVLHLVAVVMLVVVVAAAIIWNLGRHYRRIALGIRPPDGQGIPAGRRVPFPPGPGRRSSRCPFLAPLKENVMAPVCGPLSGHSGLLAAAVPALVFNHPVGGPGGAAVLPVSGPGRAESGEPNLSMPGGGGTVDVGYAAFLSPYLDRETLAFTLLVWRTYTFYWFLDLSVAPSSCLRPDRWRATLSAKEVQGDSQLQPAPAWP